MTATTLTCNLFDNKWVHAEQWPASWRSPHWTARYWRASTRKPSRTASFAFCTGGCFVVKRELIIRSSQNGGVLCLDKEDGPKRKQTSEIFEDCNRFVTPLMCPLLFPEGTDGWTVGQTIPNNHEPLHHLQYLRCHLMSRSGVCVVLHSARNLRQQFVVNEFERHQTMHLAWILNNWKTIRANVCHGLQDSVNEDDSKNNRRVVMLPASSACSDRWHHRKYKHAMAIFR